MQARTTASALVVSGFPVYTVLVFAAGFDRGTMADVLSVNATLAYFVGIFAARPVVIGAVAVLP